MLRYPIVFSRVSLYGRSFYDNNSILGTTTMSSGFMKSLQEDLQHENTIRTQGIGETLTNYINSAELTHMESPAADKQFVENLDKKLMDFFDKVPLPEDPMRVALAKTEEELKEDAAAELLKEAVREAYMRKLSAKAQEELRLKRGMDKLEKGGKDGYFKDFEEFRNPPKYEYTPVATTAASPVNEESNVEEIEKEVEAMQRQMEKLQKLLQMKKDQKK